MSECYVVYPVCTLNAGRFSEMELEVRGARDGTTKVNSSRALRMLIGSEIVTLPPSLSMTSHEKTCPFSRQIKSELDNLSRSPSYAEAPFVPRDRWRLDRVRKLSPHAETLGRGPSSPAHPGFQLPKETSA